MRARLSVQVSWIFKVALDNTFANRNRKKCERRPWLGGVTHQYGNAEATLLDYQA